MMMMMMRMRKKKVEFVKSPPDEFELSPSNRCVRQEQGDLETMMTDVLMSPVDTTRHSKNEQATQHEVLFEQVQKTKKKSFLSRRQRSKLLPSSLGSLGSLGCKVVRTANFISLSDDDERFLSSATQHRRPTALIHPLNSSSSDSSSTVRNHLSSSSSLQETMAPRGVTTPSLSPADYCFYLRRHVHLQVKDGSSDSSDSDGDTSHQHHNTTPHHQYRVRPPSHPTSSSSSSNSHHHYNHQHVKQAHGKLHSVTSSLSSGLESPSVSELLSSLVQDLKNVPSGFVTDFCNEQNNGIALLLDILRNSLNQQQCPGMVFSEPKEATTTSRGKEMSLKNKQLLLKKAMADEYNCLQVLESAVSMDSQVLRKILSHKNGLSTLASCIVSNLTKSRIVALQKLEEEKINLMLSERQMREKVEDYEQEMMQLKHQLSQRGPSSSSSALNSSGTSVSRITQINHSGNKRNGNVTSGGRQSASDSSDINTGTGDSGRWSDSDGCDSGSKYKSTGDSSDERPSHGSSSLEHQHQKNRNEDIFIYIPASIPPEIRQGLLPAIVSNESSSKNSHSPVREIRRSPSPLESRWKHRQRQVSSTDNSKEGNVKKPTVVQVLPKKISPSDTNSDDGGKGGVGNIASTVELRGKSGNCQSLVIRNNDWEGQDNHDKQRDNNFGESKKVIGSTSGKLLYHHKDHKEDTSFDDPFTSGEEEGMVVSNQFVFKTREDSVAKIGSSHQNRESVGGNGTTTTITAITTTSSQRKVTSSSSFRFPPSSSLKTVTSIDSEDYRSLVNNGKGTSQRIAIKNGNGNSTQESSSQKDEESGSHFSRPTVTTTKDSPKKKKGLSSYFFAGTISRSKSCKSLEFHGKYNSKSSIDNDDNDRRSTSSSITNQHHKLPDKSGNRNSSHFPLYSFYHKNNFIKRGHGNCGIFSSSSSSHLAVQSSPPKTEAIGTGSESDITHYFNQSSSSLDVIDSQILQQTESSSPLKPRVIERTWF